MPRKERKAHKKAGKQLKKARRDRNKEFGFVTYSFVILFLCLLGYLVYFNIVRADDVIRSPYNARQDSYAKHVVRGKIYDKDKNILAETKVAADGSETREYPYGSLYAHAVGYNLYGKSGLESRANYDLLTSHAFFLDKIKRDFQEQKQAGDSIVTTLDTKLQQAASDALGSRKGAVVLLQPSTGKMLAMVSKPTYDPNKVADNWDSLNKSENSELLNRATQGLYAPGSTFKVITTLEYIRENPDYANYHYQCTGTIEHQGTKISCHDGTEHGDVDLAKSLAYSCNTSFSNIGLSLDTKKFMELTDSLYFGQKLPGDFGAARTSVGLTAKASDADKMMTAMGQGRIKASPYHMALIASAVANGGKLMTPYMVEYVINDGGTVVDETKPKQAKSLMTAAEAGELKKLMLGVTDYGTASQLSGRGYTVAGKTGTAEYSSDKEKDHSWFIGFTNVDNPDLAISVIIESADGGASAANVARKVFDAYYK